MLIQSKLHMFQILVLEHRNMLLINNITINKANNMKLLTERHTKQSSQKWHHNYLYAEKHFFCGHYLAENCTEENNKASVYYT